MHRRPTLGQHAPKARLDIGEVDRFRVAPAGVHGWRLTFYRGERRVACELTLKQAEFLRGMLEDKQ